MSSLSADQLRALFAKGILKHGKGSRKNPRGKVIFDRKRDKEIKKMQGKGNAGATYRQKGSTHVGENSGKNFAFRGNKYNHNTNAVKNSSSLSKSGAGLKAAHLRGGQGGKPKVDHSATRAARIADSNKTFRIGDNAKREANRILEGARNRGGDSKHGLPFDRAIVAMKPRVLQARVEMLKRIGMNVAPENLGGTGREFSARIRNERARRASIGRRTASRRALQEKYGPDAAERILKKYTGRTAQR